MEAIQGTVADMAASYAQFSGAIKYKFSDTLDGALIFDQPFGANVNRCLH